MTTTKTHAVKMTSFTKLTSNQRVGVVVLIPHPSENISDSEAREIVELVEEFARHFRAQFENGSALVAPQPAGGAPS